MSKKSISEHITNLADDLSEIKLTEPMYHGQNYKKMDAYNNKINIPLQKIWLKLPKVKIFKPTFGYLKDKKSIQLTVILSPNVGEIKKFKLFIKKIERKIKNIMKSNNTLRSSIRSSKFDNIFDIKMPCHKFNDCYEFDFHIYNCNNKRISLHNLNSGTYITAFIELSEVWTNDSNIGFNWKILQMKVYPEFDFTKCLFEDDDISSESNIIEECYHCLYCPNRHVRTHFCNNTTPIISPHQQELTPPLPPPLPVIIPKKNYKIVKKKGCHDRNNVETKSTSFIPSMTDILSVKLRPVNKQIECKKYDKVDNDIIEAKDNLKANTITS